MSNILKSNPNEFIATPGDLVQEMLDLLNKYHDGEITEILEPCAGAYDICQIIEDEQYDVPILAYDIDPKHAKVKQADFLKLPIKYAKGRVSVTNVPFSKSGRFLNAIMRCSDFAVVITSGSNLLDRNVWYNDIYDVVLVEHRKYQQFIGGKYTANLWVLKKK